VTKLRAFALPAVSCALLTLAACHSAPDDTAAITDLQRRVAALEQAAAHQASAPAPVRYELLAPQLNSEPRYYPTEDECLDAKSRMLGDAANQAATARANTQTTQSYGGSGSLRVWQHLSWGNPSASVRLGEQPVRTYGGSAPTPPYISCVPIR
jgi:hypothetical protein